MSKLQPNTLKEAVSEILNGDHWLAKKRNFVEKVDIQFKVKKFNINKDRRFYGALVLPVNPRPTYKVTIIADVATAEKCKELGIPFLTIDDIKKWNKNKKLVKKALQQIDKLLCVPSIIRIVPRLFGATIQRMGKFPLCLPTDSYDLHKEVLKVQSTIKLQMRRDLTIGVTVGHMNMTEDEVVKNAALTINFMASLMPKHWQNMGGIVIKSTMGPPYKVY